MSILHGSYILVNLLGIRINYISSKGGEGTHFSFGELTRRGQRPVIDPDSNCAASLSLSRLTTHCARKPTRRYSLRGSESVPGTAQTCQETAKLSVQ